MPFNKHLQPGTRFKTVDDDERGRWCDYKCAYDEDHYDGEGDDDDDNTGEGVEDEDDNDHDENDENLGNDLSEWEAQPLVKGDWTISILIHRLFHRKYVWCNTHNSDNTDNANNVDNELVEIRIWSRIKFSIAVYVVGWANI